MASFSFLYTLPTIAGSHTGMPLVIKTADFPAAALDGTANAILNGGGNLRAYTNSTKAVRLPLDIVSLVSSGSPNAVVHVRIGTAVTGATIFFETHDSETTQPAVGAAFGRNAVWVDYEAVLHLTETGNGTAGEYVDSTGNGHDGQLTNGTAPPAAVSTNHPFGGVWSGFGDTHAITLANTAGVIGGSIFNYSIFYNLTTLNNAKGLFGNRYGSGSIHTQIKLNGQGRVNGSTFEGTQGAPNVTHKIQIDADGSGFDVFQLGVLKGSGTAGSLVGDGDFRIGTYFDASSERFIDGNACEARIRKLKLGASWITAEYANQTGNGDWASISAWAESLAAGEVGLVLQAQNASLTLAAEYTATVNNTVVELYCVGSGTSTTHLVDANNPDNNLLINYQTNKAIFENDASGTGLSFTAAAASASAAYAELANAKDVGDIATKFAGVKKLWVLIVLDLTAGHSNGSRIFHFGESGGNGIFGLTVTTSKLEVRWDNAASGQSTSFPLPPVAKSVIAINVDTDLATGRIRVYYDKVEQSPSASSVTQFKALTAMSTTSGAFVVGNRGSANRGIQGVIRYLKIVKEENLTTQEVTDSYDGLLANDDVDWAFTPTVYDVSMVLAAQSAQLAMIAQALFNYTTPVENIMTSVKSRVFGTSVSTSSPFTFTAHADSNALAEGDRFYTMIEQTNNTGIWANVAVVYTASGTSMAVVELLETSEADNSMPTFASAVNIFGSTPLMFMSDAQEDGRDAILILGDGNAVGNNGTTLTTAGWSEVLDHVDANVLTLNLGSLVANATHSATATNALVTNKYLPAAEPLPHVDNAGLFPPPNSVGFGPALGREYFHRQPWARQTVLLPVSKTAASSFSTGEWTQGSGAMYTSAQTIANTFLAENTHNKIAMIVICLGINDSALGANAAFEAALDALINKLRGDAFTGNTLQSDFSKVPVVVCGLPNDFITTVGAAATAIESSISTTPGRLRNTAFANTDAGYLTDTSDYYLDANAQREFAKVIYTAYTNTFTNVVV